MGPIASKPEEPLMKPQLRDPNERTASLTSPLAKRTGQSPQNALKIQEL